MVGRGPGAPGAFRQAACGRIELARLFVIVGGLVVALLTAALVAPYFIDWTSYRADFEREASRILGRPVTVEGTARARLLPFPSVTFTDVKVAGAGPAAPAMTVQEFSMDAELAPFLRGEVLIFDMRLVRPVATIDIDAQGRVDWAVRPSAPFDPSQVTLEKVTISDGSVTLLHRASGRAHRLTDIDAVVSARTLAGPWHVDGTLAVDGVPTTLALSTGKAESGDGMRVRIEARPQPYPLDLEADGRVRLDAGGAASYAGTFRLLSRAAPADAAKAAGEPAADKAAPSANRVTGRFTLAHDRLAIDEFRLQTGPADDPYTADGQAFLDLGPGPRFSVTADGAQISFDGSDAGASETGTPGVPLAERMAMFRRFLLGLPRPSIPGTVHVNLPAIVAGDTTIREISLEAEPAPEGWSIGSIAATLPGRTRFEGHGLLATEGRLAFTGSLLLAVKQPSGFAAWLAKDVDDAIRRLPAAGFSADVDLTQERQSFSNLELILGDARFRGSIERRQPADARPSMSVRLSGESLDVEGMAAFASLFVSDAGAMRLADHDIDLDVKAGPVSAGGLVADSVDTALRLHEGRLEIDRLKIDGLAGASVSATGTLADLAAEPSGKLDATVVAVDLAPLVAALARRFPHNRFVGFMERRAHFYPGLLEDAEIDFVASAAAAGGGATGIAVSARGTAGGTAFSFGLSGKGRPDALDAASFSASFSARNDEAATLYALYGLPALPLGLAGGARTEFSLDGTLAGARTHFLFSGDGLKATAEGTAAFSGQAPAFKGEAHVDADNMEPWLAAAGVALPGFGFGLPAQLQAALELQDGRLTLGGLNGLVAESAVAGDLAAVMKEGRPHLTGSLDLEALDLALPAAMIVGDTALAADAGLPWPHQPFRRYVTTPLSADLALGVRSLSFGRVGAGRDAAMHAVMSDEGLRLDDITASLDGGRLSGFLELKNNDGSGLLSAQLRLADADMAKLLPQGALSGRADVSAGLSASGKSVEAMVAGLSGSGSMVLRGLAVAGMNPDALRPILARADAIGRDIDADDAAAFAPAIVRAGTFHGGDAELAFTVAGGVLRAPPLQLHDGKATMTIEARADLPALTADIRGSLAYEAGLEAVAGSEPVVRFTASGPLAAVHTRIETRPLAQYLTQRALEREQARVEHMQAVLLEKQRLRREATYFAALEETRRRADEERRRFQRETERLREEAARKAEREAQARRQAEEEAARKAREEREKVPAEEPQADAAPPGVARNAGSGEIEQAPLPPPKPRADATGEGQGGAGKDGDDIGTFFRAEDLTVDGLMKLLGPRR